MEPWRTAITTSDETHIWIHGRDITNLMSSCTFTDTIFLLYRGRLPQEGERQLLDAILTASSDHGPGSPSAAAARLAATGNRESLSAALAAGVLAIGDAHGGAGQACMQLIASGLQLAAAESITIQQAAERVVAEYRSSRKRLPGIGHRTHSADPRAVLLFDLASQAGLAGDGIAFIQALEAAVSQQIKPMPVNVDGALGAVLYDLGFPPEAGKLLFITGRMAGLAVEVLEEITREKPMRVKIPVHYDGVPPQEY